jgi:hypothetical protein
MTFGLAPPKNITTLFRNWLKGIPKKDLIQIRVGVCIVYGLYGKLIMILISTSRKCHLYWRLFLWSPTGSVQGPISNQWSIGRTWILGAPIWRRSLGIYTSSASGDCIIGSILEVSLLSFFLLFRWLIHVSNLCNP